MSLPFSPRHASLSTSNSADLSVLNFAVLFLRVKRTIHFVLFHVWFLLPRVVFVKFMFALLYSSSLLISMLCNISLYKYPTIYQFHSLWIYA